MKYMGSKNRISKDLLPIILKGRFDGQYYVEPFVGGCNMIDKVAGNRIGSDNNKYLIALIKSLINGYNPINFISREDYYDIKLNKENYDFETVALCGILASYNGNWFRAYGGYSETKTGKDRNYYKEGLRGLLKQVPSLVGIDFRLGCYTDLKVPENSIIYCDPPYEKADKFLYKENRFNHDNFWQWCREMTLKGHKVYVSEYNAPIDFNCIWEKEVSKTHPNQANKSIERLFIFSPHRKAKSFSPKANSIDKAYG